MRQTDLINKLSDVIEGKVCQGKARYKMNKKLHQCMEGYFLFSINYELKKIKKRGKKEGESEGRRERLTSMF